MNKCGEKEWITKKGREEKRQSIRDKQTDIKTETRQKKHIQEGKLECPLMISSSLDTIYVLRYLVYL